MSKFLLLWSIISPLCLACITALHFGFTLLGFASNSWEPVSLSSFVLYFVYWLCLGVSQGLLLFWRSQNRKFASLWAIATSLGGFLIVSLHDLALFSLGVDTGGQGILVLLLSLPTLAALGGIPLGLLQWQAIAYLKKNNRKNGAKITTLELWLGISFLSWASSFICVFLGLFVQDMFRSYDSRIIINIIIFFMAYVSGTAMKGWFLQRLTKHKP